MKFNNPKVLADTLSSLSIQPDPTRPIEIQDIVVPTVLLAGGSATAASVKITNGTNTLNVNTDGSLSVGLPGKANLIYYASPAARLSTAATPYTVTAGKTLYIVAIHVMNYGGTASIYTLYDGTTSANRYDGYLAANETENYVVNYPGYIFKVDAGHALTIDHAFGANKMVLSFYGYEV